MKKALSLLLCLTLLLAACLLLSSCDGDGDGDGTVRSAHLIDFDEQYNYYDHSYYVFHSDGTGEFVTDRFYSSEYVDDYTLSGTVSFLWREAADGAIYLFRTETHYNENHTEGYTIGLEERGPIYFGKDFFVGVEDSTRIYVQKGSELDTLTEAYE